MAWPGRPAAQLEVGVVPLTISTTQAPPGASAIGPPVVEVSVVPVVSDERDQVPSMRWPSRNTDTGPVPTVSEYCDSTPLTSTSLGLGRTVIDCTITLG